ncbi:unnamed protein product [Cylicostephanus goldi]|uniref:Uncharacterized protein n=1 Tax=Cylicostephanus goldi TaxID=71465 RepID=A0A3P6UUN4_CYLGO|nr:unnamed protein product [Cylicostephanus goldi]
MFSIPAHQNNKLLLIAIKPLPTLLQKAALIIFIPHERDAVIQGGQKIYFALGEKQKKKENW